MEEMDLEEFAKEVFKNERLDEPSSNFDYLVLQKIQEQTTKVVVKPLFSPFKWAAILIFVVVLIVGSFYFNTGSNSENYALVGKLVNGLSLQNLSSTTTIAVLISSVFIIAQVILLKKMHRKIY